MRKETHDSLYLSQSAFEPLIYPPQILHWWWGHFSWSVLTEMACIARLQEWHWRIRLYQTMGLQTYCSLNDFVRYSRRDVYPTPKEVMKETCDL